MVGVDIHHQQIDSVVTVVVAVAVEHPTVLSIGVRVKLTYYTVPHHLTITNTNDLYFAIRVEYK